MKTSLFTILAASFFKTKDMKTDFNNQLVDGLMPAMIVFIARQGYHIDDIQYVTLAHDGSLHAKGDGSGAPGVQITYGGGRTLLYFQADLEQRRAERKSRLRAADASPRAGHHLSEGGVLSSL